jgi:hypothetical protein
VIKIKKYQENRRDKNNFAQKLVLIDDYNHDLSNK